MALSKPLTAAFVKTVNRPGRYGDGWGGHGLSLLVKPGSTGRWAKSWSQRLRIDGIPFNIGLGSYPIVTLSEARAKALQNRRAVELGQDPRRRREKALTFAEAIERVIALHEKSWTNRKSAAQWRSSLGAYALPRLGRLPVHAMTGQDIMEVLEPIWSTLPETARRVKQRISAVMRWAISQGLRQDDPTSALGMALPRNGTVKQHHRALPHAQVRDALRVVRESNAWEGSKLALAFIALTAVRSGEARLARWGEIDTETATWTIPGERMKSRRPHRVPLCQTARRVLERAREIDDGSGLVFPSATKSRKPLSDSTLSKLLRELGVAMVPHGLRSSFRDWCGETGVPRELAEAALAHVVKGVEGAYARSDLLERRRPLMEAWGQYVMAE